MVKEQSGHRNNLTLLLWNVSVVSLKLNKLCIHELLVVCYFEQLQFLLLSGGAPEAPAPIRRRRHESALLPAVVVGPVQSWSETCRSYRHVVAATALPRQKRVLSKRASRGGGNDICLRGSRG
jgi:hypothetical protein